MLSSGLQLEYLPFQLVDEPLTWWTEAWSTDMRSTHLLAHDGRDDILDISHVSMMPAALT